MAHLLSSSSSLIRPLSPKTTISIASFKSRASSLVAHFNTHARILHLKVGNSCFHSSKSSTLLFSGLRETMVDKELEEEVEGVSWIDLFLPNWLAPYAHLARLDKPIGSWLFAWPFMWSITLATPSGNLPNFRMMALFGVVCVIWRGAACTINDYFDRDIDAKVQRTKSRPLACGLVTSLQALCFSGCGFILGVGILLQLNNSSFILGAPWPFLISIYPLFKRVTYWPQAYLGFTCSWGTLLGWASIKDNIDLQIILPLFTSGVCWTLIYDTIYAHQDKEDDMKLGVKSTALLFGDQTKTWISGFSIASLSGLLLSGFNANIGWPFYLFVTIGATQLAWQIVTVNLSSPNDCKKKFTSNNSFGAIIFIGMLLGRLIT